MQTLINCVFDLFKILLILEVIRFLCFKLFTRNRILRFFFTRVSGSKFYFKRRLKHYQKLAKRFERTVNKLVVSNENKHKDKTTHKKVVNDSNVIYYKKNSKLRHKWNK